MCHIILFSCSLVHDHARGHARDADAPWSRTTPLPGPRACDVRFVVARGHQRPSGSETAARPPARRSATRSSLRSTLQSSTVYRSVVWCSIAWRATVYELAELASHRPALTVARRHQGRCPRWSSFETSESLSSSKLSSSHSVGILRERLCELAGRRRTSGTRTPINHLARHCRSDPHQSST